MTKLTTYFEKKDPSLGVTAYIVESRFGVPDTTRVLGKSYLTSAEVNVSADASLGTVFTFINPIFLADGETYVFLIKPDGDSPEYRIWLGETGGYDVASGVQVYQNPYAGVAFVSSNFQTWTPLQKEDIKFILSRAAFTTGSAVALLNNENDDFLLYESFIRASSNLYIQAGDLVYTANSSAALVGANSTQPFGIVQYIDEANQIAKLDSSTGYWPVGNTIQFHRPTAIGNTSLINANSLIANAVINTVSDYAYHAVVPRFATLLPSRTNLTFTYKGVDVSDAVDATFTTVVNDTETEFFDETKYIKSYTNEITELSGAKSCRYSVNFTTQSEFVSPVIDLRKKTGLMIENIINNGTDRPSLSMCHSPSSSTTVRRPRTLTSGYRRIARLAPA
jgi:hypothetical protein